MVQDRTQKAIETFTNAGLTQAEAEVYVHRELMQLSREETRQQLEKESKSTVDSLHQNAKDKAEMPAISKIETHARVTPQEDKAVVIWFENGAKLRYRVADNTVYEETFNAVDPHSVHESFDLAVNLDELEETALESVSEYINNYQDDPEALRKDWSNVYSAIALYE